MKNIPFIIVFICSFFPLFAQETEINGCEITHYTWARQSSYSFEAYGNVYVETDPKKPVDLYVKIVDSPQKATYKVFTTSDTPKKCGEWRFVNDRKKAKFTIRYVKESEDCTIYFTKDRTKTGWF